MRILERILEYLDLDELSSPGYYAEGLMLTDFRPYYWFPGPWTRVTSVVSLTTAAATAAAAAMFPNPNF